MSDWTPGTGEELLVSLEERYPAFRDKTKCGLSPDGKHHLPHACTCDHMALEPDEDCPQHGHGPWPPRCAYCGQFLPWEMKGEPQEP